MNRRIALAAALALSLCALPLMAQQPPAGGVGQGQRMGGPGRGRGPGGPGGPLGVLPGLNQVDLSDQQREQVRAIMEQERQTSGDPGQKSRDAEQALHAALLADTPDPQVIESAKAALNTAHAAELDHRVELMQKIVQILTPVQRQQLAQLQPPAGGRRGGGA
jgi:Spy/CpxP family protein refolding chaperone